MDFVTTPEESKLSHIGISLQYQYNQCNSVIIKKTNYPNVFNENDDKYYETYKDDENVTCRAIKDIIEIGGKIGRVSSLYSNYLILVPCRSHADLLTIWENARIKTIEKYGSFY